MKTFASTVFINACLLVISALGQAPNNILHGEVTQDGKPISGAIVSIYQLTQEGYAKTIVSNTNDEGKYLFATLPKGDYAIIINKGDTRLYQGMISIGPKLDNIRNVPLSSQPRPKLSGPTLEGNAPPTQPSPSPIPQGDQFTGKWKLNLALSRIPS